MKLISYLLAIQCCLVAASMAVAAQPIPFDTDHWDFRAQSYKIETYKGKTCLVFHKGLALVKGSQDFVNGIIEFDIAVPAKRGFSGPVWRVQDDLNYEEFYLRHHQSGNEDANQYSPVFNGLAGWQLYYSADGYGYPLKYAFDEWMPVKIIIAGPKAEIYVQDMTNPILFIPEMKREITNGWIGLRDQGFAPARYANFRYTKMDTPPMIGHGKKVPSPKGPAAALADNARKRRAGTGPAAKGTIMSWSVSNAFPAKSMAGKHQLSDADLSRFQWTRLNCDTTGLANLGRINGLSEIKRGNNTVFAKTTVTEEADTLRKLEFAFSDAVKVYLNGQLLFEASDMFRSRDYRFLGSIGFFDALYLPLKRGSNEIHFAVTERFGGWGLKARFLDD